MTSSPVVVDLWLNECGSCSDLASSCGIWRVAAAVLLSHLGWVCCLFNAEITRLGRGGRRDFCILKEEQGLKLTSRVEQIHSV